MLFIWNVSPAVCVDWTRLVSELQAELAGALGVFGISEIMQPSSKSKSVSQLIKGKSRDFQKLLKYFNGTATFVSTVLYYYLNILPISFVLYSKDLVVFFLLLFIL